MSKHKACPDCPEITDEHEITEEEIRQQKIFELEVEERSWLAGPRSRFHDLCSLIRVGLDLIRAYRILHFVGPCVTIFGSARTKPGTRWYELARQMGAASAELGFTVLTGGGPGIMQAGNQGAFESGGRSIGVIVAFDQVPCRSGCPSAVRAIVHGRAMPAGACPETGANAQRAIAATTNDRAADTREG